MPIYTYNCKVCGIDEDKLVSLSKRNDSQNCKKCKKVMERILINNPRTLYRGHGFYETDEKHVQDSQKRLEKIIDTKAEDKTKEKQEYPERFIN